MRASFQARILKEGGMDMCVWCVVLKAEGRAEESLPDHYSLPDRISSTISIQYPQSSS